MSKRNKKTLLYFPKGAELTIEDENYSYKTEVLFEFKSDINITLNMHYKTKCSLIDNCIAECESYIDNVLFKSGSVKYQSTKTINTDIKKFPIHRLYYYKKLRECGQKVIDCNNKKEITISVGEEVSDLICSNAHVIIKYDSVGIILVENSVVDCKLVDTITTRKNNCKYSSLKNSQIKSVDYLVKEKSKIRDRNTKIKEIKNKKITK